LFEWILLRNLFPHSTAEQVARYRWPFNQTGPTVVNLSPEGKISGGSENMVLPFILALVVMLPLFTSGSYLLQSLAREKSNRVMEILLVSLKPRQLLTGKLLGIGALTLIQYLGWAAIGVLAFIVSGMDASRWLADIHLSLGEVALLLPYALAAFILYAGLMAGIGAMAPNLESSRSWVFVLSLPMLFPIYVWGSIIASPNGPLAVALSLIPFSSPVAMLMRLTRTVVPMWQIIVSITLLAMTDVLVVWLMARLFRVQTLLSGESLSLRRVWTALSG
jgi:ABC-2 type transport system permease protein